MPKERMRAAMSCERLMKSLLISLVCIALLIGGSPTILHGQTGTATLSGTIMDPSGKVVPGADVSITNVDTGVARETKTNGDGIYVLPALQPGRYRVIVTKPGFKQVALTDVTLNTQDSVSRNFNLEVGAVSETVTVTGTNGMWSTTDSPAVGTLVTRDFVENMPLNGRSFQDLIALTPGTVSSATSQVGGTFNVNGQRDDANNFMVDGVSANVNAGAGAQGMAGVIPSATALGTTQSLLSVDAMQEFRIETSGYTADSGRQPGGQVQLTSRSGTNDWHGTAFDYLRNTVFDANNWFANQQRIPRLPEHQNDFGGTLGGPVVLPKVYNGKDRTFFFFSYEGLRLLLPNFLQTVVPTQAFRTAAAPAVQPFLNAFPLPNGPNNTSDGCTVDGTPTGTACDAQFNAGYDNPSSINAFSIRVDQDWGQKVRLFVRYGDTPSKSITRLSPGNAVAPTTLNTRSLTFGASTSIRQEIINDLRFNYSYSGSVQSAYLDNFGGAVPFPESLVVPPQYLNGVTSGGAGFFLSGSAISGGVGVGTNTSSTQTQYNIVDGLSLVSGTHAVKLGVDYRRLQPEFAESSYHGFLYFTSVAQVQQGTPGDFLQASKAVYPTFWNLSLYAQDRWKATPRITVDYGLRWEFNPPPGEANGLFPVAVTQVNNLSNLQVAPVGTSPYHARYLNFAPRLGISWNVIPSQHHALVVRAGSGLYFDTGQAQWAASYTSTLPPFGNTLFLPTISLPVSAAEVPPPSIPTSPVGPPYEGLTTMDPNLKLPYTIEYNLSADFGLSQRNTLTMSYVGNEAHRLLFTGQYQNLPNVAFLALTNNAGASSYNALQLQDRGYVAPGLEVLASYTWAHAIDNVSSDYSGFGTVAPIRGNSNNDIRHTLNLAMNYEIPGARSNSFLRALTLGWLLSNRFTAQSGFPFGVTQGTYSDALFHTFSIYPDLVRGVPLYLHGTVGVPDGWQLNPAAFNPVPLNPDGSPVRQGDLPRNFLRAPGFWNLNTAIQRTFPIHERLKLVFRSEAFNLFNHPSFTCVDTFIPSPQFGQLFCTQTIGVANPLYATGSPRSFQLMLKLQF